MHKNHKSDKPISVGSGLIALDVVINGTAGQAAKLFAGGSCGNIMTILSFLGWRSIPLARLSISESTVALLNDLKEWNVDVNWLKISEDGSTPVILHRVLRNKSGKVRHRFEFTLPSSKKRLPYFKPLRIKDLHLIKESFPLPNVFYFDKVAPSMIQLASEYKKLGCVVIFEPSSYGKPEVFDKCLRLSTIVKFSHERLPDYAKRFQQPKAILEIETLGENGMKFRSKVNCSWTHLAPLIIKNELLDGGGAGDWSTAGLINFACKNGLAQFNSQVENGSIARSLDLAQALGGINCCFLGARGAMYHLARKDILQLVERSSKTRLIEFDTNPILKSPATIDVESLQQLLSQKV